MSRPNGSGNKKNTRVQRSFRLSTSIDKLLQETKEEHNFATLTEALEYLLIEKAIEKAMKDANIDI